MKITAPSHFRHMSAALAACAVVTLAQCDAGSTTTGDAPVEQNAASSDAPIAGSEQTLSNKKAAAGEGKPIAVTAAEFGKFIEAAKGVVLVDFWAEWCQPCHIIAPEVEKVAGKYSGRVQVVKVDLTEDPGEEFSDKYGIDFLPTLLIFKDGKSQGNLVVNGRPMPDAAGISAALDKQL